MTTQTTTTAAAMSLQTDRISRLPDDVLHNILSHLPNTEARARTSLLSKRFLHLWAHHPSVCIGDSQILRFLRPSDSDSAATIGRYQISVDRCLASLLCPVLQTLELNLFSTRRSFRWIRSAADRHVRGLRLSADPSTDLKIPVSIFFCTSLVSLDLYCCQLPRIRPKFGGFPSLTHLKITGRTETYENLASLLSKCPSLQSLKLQLCHDLTTLDLSSQNLTDIDIFYCPGLHRVRIDAPNLTSFSYSGNVNKLYLENAHRLLDANLCHFSSGTGTDFATSVEWARPVRSLSHVSNRLRVNEWFFKFLLPETPEPLFGNLKMLHCIVHWVTSSVLNGLAAMLGHCPNLEQLKIDLSCGVRRSIVCFKQLLVQLNTTQEEWGMSPAYMDKFEQERKDDSEQDVWDPSELPADVTPSLKTIIVDSFLGTANEMKMLEYLLGRSSVLEKLSIGDCMMRDKEEIHRLFAYIPRASSHVQICELNMLK